MTDRALLLCAGKATRWGRRHGDAPKQLVVLRGEPILHRTARLLDPDRYDIRVVVADSSDDVWRIPGTKRARAQLDPRRSQADKILSSAHLWAKNGRTIIVFGDVYLTDEAANTITTNTDPWSAFARFGASALTGCNHRELFAFAFDPDEHDRIRDAAERCLAIHRAGKMGGWSGGWQTYAAAAGATDAEVASRFVDRGNIVNIDDWTDDFDSRDDWDRWCLRWARATPAERAIGHPDLEALVP